MEIQRTISTIGEYGCYFLSLLKTAGDSYVRDFYKYYKIFTTNGWMLEDCTVMNPCEILRYLLKCKFRVVKSDTLDKQAFIVVEYWYNPRTCLHHFKLPNWDPLGDSVTCREGHIESYRLFYKE